MKLDTHNIYIVEDDEFYGSMLEHYLSLNPDYQVRRFNSASSFLKSIHEKPDVVTLDYSLPDSTGDKLLQHIIEVSPYTRVIMVSGQNDIQVAVDLMKKGAYAYIVKNDETKDRLWMVLETLGEHFALQQKIQSLQHEVTKKYNFKSIIGGSIAIRKVFDLIEKASATNITVSITGETGTGKELAAKSIHFNSARKDKPFVAVNIAAIPRELIESELFGHEKGAFTSAVARRIGKFEEASKGTLFLDEIGEMPLDLQAKLLRVLQEKELSRVGSNEVLQIDVRIIVATHKNLLQEVKKGNFREDLYYRLLGLPVHLPPLRERDSDVLLIAKYFIDAFCKENNLQEKHLSVESKKLLLQHPYPGNIRQLKSMVELACVLTNSTDILPEHIEEIETPDTGNFDSQCLTLKQHNTHIIQHCLDINNFDVLKVARILDIGKSTIYRMINNGELILYKNTVKLS